MTAYLILNLELRDGALVPTGAAIYGSDPMNLTGMSGVTRVEVLRCAASDYGAATKAVEDTLEAMARYQPGYAAIKALYEEGRR